MAVAQTGIEALRWLRDESDSEASSRNLARHGHFGEATLVLGSRAAQKLPRLAYRDVVEKLLLPEFDLIGVGAEAIVLAGDDDKVNKYLTGKTHNPLLLAHRLRGYRQKIEPYIGDFLVPSIIGTEYIKLFKGIPAQHYVHISQPLVEGTVLSPNVKKESLESTPEIDLQLRHFASGLVTLFQQEGILMDIVNTNNLIWTTGQDESSGQLVLTDDIPVEFTASDFTGIHVPLWTPGLQLEALASFTLAHGEQEQPLDLSLMITESLLAAYKLPNY